MERQFIDPYEIYTVQQLAKLLHLSRQSIYNMRSQGKLLPKPFKVGGAVRYRGEDVIQFIKDQQD